MALLRRVLKGDVSPEIAQRSVDWVEAIDHDLQRLQDGLGAVIALLTPPTAEQRQAIDLRRFFADVEWLLAGAARRQTASLQVEVEDSARVEARRSTLLLIVCTLSLYGLEAPGDEPHTLDWKVLPAEPGKPAVMRLAVDAAELQQPLREAVEELIHSEKGDGISTRADGPPVYELRFPGVREERSE